ncbi:MAG: hypothetical protein JRI96_07415 [Deltaproteobacteria bacterium]|nr:hypothetical protein [Deltaproteobacteria bacterium]
MRIIIILGLFLAVPVSYAEIGKSVDDFKNSRFAESFSLRLSSTRRAEDLGFSEYKGKMVFNFANPSSPRGVSLIASPNGENIVSQDICLPYSQGKEMDEVTGYANSLFALSFINEATGGRIAPTDKTSMDILADMTRQTGATLRPVVRQIKGYTIEINQSIVGLEYIVRKKYSRSTNYIPYSKKRYISCKIQGISYSEHNPSVAINGAVHYVNDSVCGGKIINISFDKVTIKFQDEEKDYSVGDVIDKETKKGGFVGETALMGAVVAGHKKNSSIKSTGVDDRYVGPWMNEDANTRSITRVEIRNEFIHMWGKCHPTDCDWGENSYSVSGNELHCVWDQGFCIRNQIISLLPDGRLKVITDVHYLDARKRKDHTNTDYFIKGNLSSFNSKASEERPREKQRSSSLSKREDCVCFSSNRVQAVNVKGRWKIVDGNHWLLDFNNNKTETLQALRIIKHYSLNKHCFVGRPDPSMEYYLVNGKAPQGAARREDCLTFNLNNIEVKRIKGRWKIVDRDHWILDFDTQEPEARQAYEIIKKYGFKYICFVGRPKASMTYFRR